MERGELEKNDLLKSAQSLCGGDLAQYDILIHSPISLFIEKFQYQVDTYKKKDTPPPNPKEMKRGVPKR